MVAAKPHTTALLSAIARWRRIEAAARNVDIAAHVYDFYPSPPSSYSERQALKELHRVITEEKP